MQYWKLLVSNVKRRVFANLVTFLATLRRRFYSSSFHELGFSSDHVVQHELTVKRITTQLMKENILDN